MEIEFRLMTIGKVKRDSINAPSEGVHIGKEHSGNDGKNMTI